MNRILSFFSNEDGAVTVDWVVLTAGITGLGLLVVLRMAGSVQHVDNEIGQALSGVEIQELAFETDN